jgi:hypothetical protein
MDNSIMVLLNGFFGLELIQTHDFIELIFRTSINLAVILILVRWLYYTGSRRKDYLFTYILISTLIFLLCYLLENVKLQLGFALGLFAIFGIIRYRTDAIPIKEMTYLFLVIGISVVNALANKKISYAELFFANFTIIAIAFVLEKVTLLRHETRKTVIYEKIELIKPENYELLKQDLENRTGIKINRIEIGRIDFLRDTAQIRIFYYQSENEPVAEEEIRGDNDD